MKEIELGHKVFDQVTEFQGIAIARVVYLNGCIQIQVQPKVDEKGEIKKAFWIDESQLIEIGSGVLKESKDKKISGGGFREHPNE